MKPFLSINFTELVNNPHHNPVVGGTLLAAGAVPNWFTSSNLQAVYYLCLLPPAAWYLITWFRKDIFPLLRKLWTK